MKAVLILFSLVVMGSVSAADSSSGCGLGWQVFPENTLVSSSLRATTNAMFSNTIAMTLGTSGCAKHSIVRNEKRMIHYIEANQDLLLPQMAKGEGEQLDGLAQVSDYSGDLKLFRDFVRQNYSKIAPTSQLSANDVYQNFKAIL